MTMSAWTVSRARRGDRLRLGPSEEPSRGYRARLTSPTHLAAHPDLDKGEKERGESRDRFDEEAR